MKKRSSQRRGQRRLDEWVIACWCNQKHADEQAKKPASESEEASSEEEVMPKKGTKRGGRVSLSVLVSGG